MIEVMFEKYGFDSTYIAIQASLQFVKFESDCNEFYEIFKPKYAPDLISDELFSSRRC